MEYEESNMKRVCTNCGYSRQKGDKYCRHCGIRLGKSKIIPDEMYIIYGPPPALYKSVCTICGYTWEYDNDDSPAETYCPKCGGKAASELLHEAQW